MAEERLSVEEANKVRQDYNFILRLAANDTTGSVEKFWQDLRKVIRNAKGDRDVITTYVNTNLPKVQYFSDLYGRQVEAEIQAAQPEFGADVNRAIEVKRQDVNRLVEQYGIALPEGQLDILAREAWRSGWDGEEILLNLRPFLAQTLEAGRAPGGIASDFQNDLITWARQNGIELDPGAAAKYVADMTLGNRTLDDVKQDLRMEYLAGAFPAWSDRIAAGFDPSQIVKPYRAAAAALLEIGEDDLSFNDPLMKKAMQGVGQDGKPRVVPLYEFEREVREDPRWQKTDNAYKTYSEAADTILSMFGMR